MTTRAPAVLTKSGSKFDAPFSHISNPFQNFYHLKILNNLLLMQTILGSEHQTAKDGHVHAEYAIMGLCGAFNFPKSIT